MYWADAVSVHWGGGLPNPTYLEGEVRFVQAQDKQVVTTCSSRIVTECLVTRSMLFKMYIHVIYTQSRIWTIVYIYQKVYQYNNQTGQNKLCLVSFFP